MVSRVLIHEEFKNDIIKRIFLEYNSCHDKRGRFCSTMLGMLTTYHSERNRITKPQVVADMNEFVKMFRGRGSVSDIRAQVGRGSWQGDNEESWRVSFNSDDLETALAVIAEQASGERNEKHLQDSALVFGKGLAKYGGEPSVLCRFTFKDRARSKPFQDKVDKIVESFGFGGWSWLRQKGTNNAELILAHVSQWSGRNPSEHLQKVKALGAVLRKTKATKPVAYKRKETEAIVFDKDNYRQWHDRRLDRERNKERKVA